jgi:hypothetical protein
MGPGDKPLQSAQSPSAEAVATRAVGCPHHNRVPPLLRVPVPASAEINPTRDVDVNHSHRHEERAQERAETFDPLELDAGRHLHHNAHVVDEAGHPKN